MKRGRAYEEAEKLGHQYPVRYCEVNRQVIVERFDFPEGWSPRFGAIRYDLPETYPRDMPTVYVSSEMSHEDGKPRHLMRWISPSDDGENKWSKWCIEEQNVNWDPNNDTLMKLTIMMRTSLTAPNADNPIEEVA